MTAPVDDMGYLLIWFLVTVVCFTVAYLLPPTDVCAICEDKRRSVPVGTRFRTIHEGTVTSVQKGSMMRGVKFADGFHFKTERYFSFDSVIIGERYKLQVDDGGTWGKGYHLEEASNKR